MTFLQPFAWLAAVAAAVPLLIHLLSRRKARREAFPSVRFLNQVHRQEVRRLRLREWLLLLLRTLAVACLALAFSRPAIQGSLAGGAHSPATMLALVDESLSMRAAGRSGTRFDEAQAHLRELPALADAGSEIQILEMSSGVVPVFEDFTHDPSRLRGALGGLRAGYGHNQLASSLREAARWLKGRPGLRRELYVFSDFQASSLDSATARALPQILEGLDVYWVPSGSREAPNAGWVSVEATRVAAGGLVRGEIRNPSAEARTSLLVEAEVAGRMAGAARVDLPARGSAQVEIPLAGLSPNDAGAVLHFPHDALAEDDFAAVAFPSARPLRVALVGPEGQRRYVAAAFAAAPGGFEVQVSADGSALQEADVWVVLGPERLNASALRAHLARGGGVLAALGGAPGERELERILGAASPASLLGPAGDSTGAAFVRLNVKDPAHPAFRGLDAERGAALGSARFLRYLNLRANPGATIPAEFAPGVAAMVQKGRVLFVASALDGEWNDFPLSPSFLPWLYQAAEELAARAGNLSAQVGERWVRALPPEWRGQPIRLHDPDGRNVEVLPAEGGEALRTAPLKVPGLYTMEVGGKPVEGLAVHTPAAEMDLTTLPRQSLSRWAKNSFLVEGSLRESVIRHRNGRELWREFLMAALAFLALETLVARLLTARRA